jgi:hypothetical protein
LDPKAALAAALALLQAGLTVIGGLNGGLSALIRNEKGLVIAAFFALLLGLVLISGVVFLDWRDNRRETLTIAFVAFFFALAITGVGAILAPNKQTRAQVTASLKEGDPYILEASVKIDGVPSGTNANIYVGGLQEEPGRWVLDAHGKHVFMGGNYIDTNPTLYQAHIGPDSSGQVTDKFSIPIPRDKYADVDVNAWAGTSGELCLPRDYGEVPSKTRQGCIVIRLRKTGQEPAGVQPR